MQTLIYDGTFTGLLTAVYDVYEYKYINTTLLPDTLRQDSLFGDSHVVHTNETKAERVWQGLKKYTTPQGRSKLTNTYLCERPDMHTQLLQFICYVFDSKRNIEQDYSHPAVLYVNDMAKKVHREKHRMEAFVRFQKTKDDIYYATVSPDFNVLPLISTHFEKRYADQQWLIYDTKRRYGIYYNLTEVTIVEIDFNDTSGREKNLAAVLADTEILYQQLWQNYFSSVNIPSRKNVKLHIKHMPLRYWKYLTEKQPRLR